MSTDVATRSGAAIKWDAPIEKRSALEGMLTSMQDQIAAALPEHLTPTRMIRMALTACSRQPKLLQCTAASVVGAFIECSQLGLEPGGPLGHAYLVPFYNSKTKRQECQFMPGYRGLIQLAHNTGQISTIMAALVYERDTFVIQRGLDPKLEHTEHIPRGGNDDRGELIGAYAVARLKDGSVAFEFMNMPQLNKIRNASKSRDRQGALTGPWRDWPEAMYKKTVIKQVLKLLPASPDKPTGQLLHRAIGLDDYAEGGKRQLLGDGALQIPDMSEDDDDEPARPAAPGKAAILDTARIRFGLSPADAAEMWHDVAGSDMGNATRDDYERFMERAEAEYNARAEAAQEVSHEPAASASGELFDNG